MSSWRPLAAGTVALFIVILAFLAGQLRAGADPALRRSAAAQPAPTQPDAAQPQVCVGGEGSRLCLGLGDDVAPSGTDPSPPTTQQS